MFMLLGIEIIFLNIDCVFLIIIKKKFCYKG